MARTSKKDNDLLTQIQTLREEKQKRIRERNTNNSIAQSLTSTEEKKKALQAISHEDEELQELSDKLNALKIQERQERRNPVSTNDEIQE